MKSPNTINKSEKRSGRIKFSQFQSTKVRSQTKKFNFKNRKSKGLQKENSHNRTETHSYYNIVKDKQNKCYPFSNFYKKFSSINTNEKKQKFQYHSSLNKYYLSLKTKKEIGFFKHYKKKNPQLIMSIMI